LIAFDVNDMSCGHCVAAITQAVKSVDPGAQVEVDLASHRVTIKPAQAGEQALADAIREAGYTPQPAA
jgi:copper chaperone